MAKRLLLGASAAALIATAGWAQQQQQPDQQQTQAGGAYLQAGESDIFATNIIGIAVYASEAGGSTGGGGGEIDSAQLAEFEQVGQVTDVMMGMDGTLRGIVIGLGGMDPAAAGTAPAGAATTGAAGTGMAQEIAVDADQMRFFYDENAPHLVFAVTGVPAGELQSAPALERPRMAIDGTGAVGAGPGAVGTGAAAGPMGTPAAGYGWRMGRAPMAAPGVTMQGYQPVPVGEISADNLQGSAVYGAGGEQIGSVSDIGLGEDGTAQYITLDIGGFLGIGTRTVAIGFDEMTVLRNAGWDDLQVHVSATQQDLEQLPEFETN